MQAPISRGAKTSEDESSGRREVRSGLPRSGVGNIRP
jgi:hypothetical protein